MRSKKILAAILACCMALTLLTGCQSAGAASDDSDVPTVTLWGSGSDLVRVELETIAEMFNSDPEYSKKAHLEIQFILSGTGEASVVDRMAAAYESGQTDTDFDLIAMDENYVSTVLSKTSADFLEPIDTSLVPNIKGAYRWLYIGPVNFQPSEIAKFALILIFAHLISINFDKMQTFRYGVLPYVLILGSIAGLVVMENHMSATLIILMLAGVMLFVGGVKLRWFGLAFGALGAAAAYLLFFTDKFTYAYARIAAWQNPFDPNATAEILADTWQTRQSLMAIGSGGLLGLGLGQSRQKYLYLPEPQNDFIFSVLCEELGFIGALIVIILFAMLIWRGITVSLRAKDKFGMMLGVGLTVQIGIQVILNIMVVTNTIPNTGISLPFFSAGGTSLIILLAEMGILLSISRNSAIEKT